MEIHITYMPVTVSMCTVTSTWSLCQDSATASAPLVITGHKAPQVPRDVNDVSHSDAFAPLFFFFFNMSSRQLKGGKKKVGENITSDLSDQAVSGSRYFLFQLSRFSSNSRPRRFFKWWWDPLMACLFQEKMVKGLLKIEKVAIVENS